MNRRTFLQNSILLSLISYSIANGIEVANGIENTDTKTSLSDKLFIFVFLRGGMDGLSLLSPYNSQFYYKQRPSIAIKDIPQQYKISDNFAINPKLDKLLELYNNKELTFVPYTGIKGHCSRSHFEMQDKIEMDNNLIKNSVNGLIFQNTIPLIMQGNLNKIATIDLNDKSKYTLSKYEKEFFNDNKYLLNALDNKNNFIDKLKEIETESKVITENVEKKGFIQGKMLENFQKYNVAYMELESWDTHIYQLNTLNSKLTNLQNHLIGLKKGLGKRWNDTTILYLSEFGRTFKENGTYGTDHGVMVQYLLLVAVI